jgi:hypothetical protein
MMRVGPVRHASNISVLRSVILYLTVHTQLPQDALVVVHDGHHRTRIHLNHALEVVGLNVLRAQDEGVASFLVERSEIEELTNCFSAADGQVVLLLLERSDASKCVLQVGLTCF